MKKKIILLAVIGIYFTFALSSPIVLAEDDGGSGLFSSEIVIEEVSEINDPLPLSAQEEISVKVKFKLNLEPMAKRLFFNRRIGRAIMFGFTYFFKFVNQLPKANISLSVEKPGEWCEVELDKEQVEFEYNNEFEEAEVKLNITLDENAPALQMSQIIISASYPGIGRIGANSNESNISFMPDYESNINVEAEKYHAIPPLKETKVPINITNNGNGQSSVSIEVLDLKNWNITFDPKEITIDGDQTKQITMSVIPPEGFNNETIPLTFIPISTVEDVDDIHREGNNVDFSITFINDHSLEDDGELDLTMILTIALIVIIVIILVIIILKKRK